MSSPDVSEIIRKLGAMPPRIREQLLNEIAKAIRETEPPA